MLVLPFVLAAVSSGGEAPDAITFTKHVAPIFVKSCMTCHRPGEIAPMSLLSIEEARPWAGSIKREVESRAMPPWHADPRYGTFANDRRHRFLFTNADEFRAELEGMVGQDVEITGVWRVDRIEIQKIEPRRTH